MSARTLGNDDVRRARSAFSPWQRRAALGVLAAAAALLTALALWSFDAVPTRSVAAVAIGENLIGVFGVVLGSVLTRLFGAMAWSVPVELGALALRQLSGRRSALRTPWRTLAIAVPTAVVCTLLSVGWPEAVAYGEPAGGKIGVVFSQCFITVIGYVGVWVVGLALVLVALVVRTRGCLSSLVWWSEVAPAMVHSSAAPARAEADFDAVTSRPRVRVVVPPQARRLRPTCLSGTYQGRPFALPSSTLLERTAEGGDAYVHDDDTQDAVNTMLDKLEAHGVLGVMGEVLPGPIVTTYALRPSRAAKLAKVACLADDLALCLGVDRVRVAPLSGTTCVGIEVPSPTRTTVMLRPIVESECWNAALGPLPVALGLDTTGRPVLADLSEMPHLLVGGASGSGKSVGLNAMLLSLLMRRSPDEVRLVMFDLKMVEFVRYGGIPHLLLPVVTEDEQVLSALQWVVAEMERRYQLLAAAGALNLGSFNTRSKVPIPYLVVVVDEVADLLARAPKGALGMILRLSQTARAAGIHLILSTQRPSVDILPGTVKANFTGRIAFSVSRQEDSRTILGDGGAERLLGAGDMLVVTPRDAEPKRLHGAYVSEDEVQAVCDFLRAQGAPAYAPGFLRSVRAPAAKLTGAARSVSAGAGSSARACSGPPPLPARALASAPQALDDMEATPHGLYESSDEELYRRAQDVVDEAGYCSISGLQRSLAIGYTRATRVVARMEAEGFVGGSGYQRREPGRPRRTEANAALN